MHVLQDQSHASRGCAQLAWDASSRIAVVSFTADDRLTGDIAQAMADAIDTWVGNDDDRFGMVCDCTGIGRTDAGWRAVWFEYVRTRRQRTAMVWVNPSPSTRVVVTMFKTAVRTLGSFDCTVTDTVDEARAWLADHGYAHA